MHIKLIAFGHKMPSWVSGGFTEYIKRLPREFHFQLCEIPLQKRAKNTDYQRLLQQEGQTMLAQIAQDSHCVSLDIRGKAWNSEQLAKQLACWLENGRDVCFLIGGPEGLAPACLTRAEQTWSLSSLTLPHPLVRIIFAEQLYRAWTLLSEHPYHR
jgi:23S rRNA (pseudouridine1915-N3)-methyltransferase